MTDNYWTRKALSRRRVLTGSTLTAVGLGAAALVGCGSDSDDDDSESAPTALASPGATATPAALKPGGAVKINTANPVSGAGGQDPHLNSNVYLHYMTACHAYSRVVAHRRSSSNSDELLIAPDLAEKWESPDNLTYVFTIRKGAKFHNIAPVNGREVTAEDVKYSLQRQIETKVNAAGLPAIASMEVIDPNTIKLTSPAPNSDFLAQLGYMTNKVIAKEAVAVTGDLTNGPTVGTGAFIQKQFGPETFKYERNPEYFITGQPLVDSLEAVVLQDPAAIEAQFRAGNLTHTGSWGFGPAPAVLKSFEKDGFTTSVTKFVPQLWVQFNMQAPEFQDPRVRQALNLAVDRDLISANVYEDLADRNACSMVLPGPAYLLPADELKKGTDLDVKKAKDLLSAAGANLGTMELTVGSQPQTQSAAQLVQQNFKDVGVDVNIRVVTDTTEANQIFLVRKGGYKMAIQVITHRTLTFSGDSDAYLRTNGSANTNQISDASLDSLLDKQKAEFNAEARKAVLWDIQRKFLELVPAAPMHNRHTIFAGPKGYGNFKPMQNDWAFYAEMGSRA